MHIHLFRTEEEEPINYLVQLKLSSRPATPREGTVFIEQFILPTLELCKKLEAEKRIVAGGPLSGAIALALIVSAESAEQLDDLITSLHCVASNGNGGHPALHLRRPHAGGSRPA